MNQNFNKYHFKITAQFALAGILAVFTIAQPIAAAEQAGTLLVAQRPAGNEVITPACPQDVVGGPEFVTTSGRQGAGTASIVKNNSKNYILSARHLLGPDGGFKVQTAAKDVPSFVHRIIFKSFSIKYVSSSK